MQDKQKVTLYIPPELHRRLKIQAAVDLEAMSAILERAISFYLEHRETEIKSTKEIYGKTDLILKLLHGIALDSKKFISLLIDYWQAITDQKARCVLVEDYVGNEIVIRQLTKILDRRPTVIGEIIEQITYPGNLVVIEEVRKILGQTSSALTRHVAKELLQKLDIRQPEEVEQDENNLLLFLTTTRIKETADRYFSVDRYQKKKFCYQRILACLDRMQQGRDILTRRSLMQSYLQTYQQIVRFALQSRDSQTAFIYTEFFRNRYLVERLAEQDKPLPDSISTELTEQINRAKQTERQTLQAYTDGIKQSLPEPELETLSEQWENAKQTLEKLYRQVAEIEPEFIAKTKVYPLSFAEVQQLLPPDTAIIEFFFTETQLITLLILPNTESPLLPPPLQIKLETRDLQDLAQDWVADIADKGKAKDDSLSETLQQLPHRIHRLAERLNFSQLRDYLPAQISKLILVPNNYLHLFPLHALPYENQQLLCDKFSVRYFPNLQIWKLCQNRQRSRTSFIGIENPTADKDLIFAKAEIASICQRPLFATTEILNSQTANKSTLLQQAKDRHCFHFSGHAEYNFTNPLDSYLMLSENSEENLTLSTIFADLHLPHADLVTLSACCTGIVDAFQPTDECLGIATGFLLAGAKAVISSLWKVNSIATAFLLDEFYRQLEQTDDKAVALQQAQCWLKTRTADELRERASQWNLSQLEPKERFRLDRALKRLQDIPFENPYFWAAFTLTGY